MRSTILVFDRPFASQELVLRLVNRYGNIAISGSPDDTTNVAPAVSNIGLAIEKRPDGKRFVTLLPHPPEEYALLVTFPDLAGIAQAPPAMTATVYARPYTPAQ